MLEIGTAQGLVVGVSPIGATVCSIRLQGQELTLRYHEESAYLTDPFYLGSTAGPFANRIHQARFELHGTSHFLTANDGPHCLHGGEAGLHHVQWQIEQHLADRLTLSYQAQHGEGGFPGERIFRCHIRVSDTELQLWYEAQTDRDTVVNLTNHCYFNLDPQPLTISGHRLECFLPHYLEKDPLGIPTGQFGLTAQQYPELLSKQPLAALFDRTGGIDHCFVEQSYQRRLRLQARLWSTNQGLSLSVFSDLPGLQIYSGDGLSAPFVQRQGICLEAQYWPDAPNQPEFPATSLAKGQTYRHQIIYRFERHAEP